MSFLLLLAPLNLQGLPSAAIGGGTVPAVTFVNRVIRRLNESAQTEAGAESADGGQADVTTTTQAIYDYANEGVALLCRTCWPLYGTFTQAPAVGGSRTMNYGAFAPGSDAPGGVSGGAVLWQPLMEGVSWDKQDGSAPIRFRYVAESILALRFRGYYTTPPASWAQSTTYYYAPLGAAGFAIYPPLLPSGGGVVTVRGLCIHPPAQTASALVAMFPYLPDDLLVAVEYYVCWAIAAKNLDDPILAPRARWLSEWEKRCAQLYSRLGPYLSAYFPPFSASASASSGGGNGGGSGGGGDTGQ